MEEIWLSLEEVLGVQAEETKEEVQTEFRIEDYLEGQSLFIAAILQTENAVTHSIITYLSGVCQVKLYKKIKNIFIKCIDICF